MELLKNKKLFYSILAVAIIMLVLTYSGVFKNSAEDRVTQEQNVARVITGGDETKCDEIDYKSSDGIDYRIVCKNNIAFKKAQETKDVAWCDQLDNNLFLKEDCKQMILNIK